MSSVQILKIFKSQIINFCDQIIELFPDESDFILFKLFIEQQIPIEDCINIFIKQLNRENGIIKQKIKKRDVDFFIKEKPLKISDDKLNLLIRIWTSDTLDEDDKENMWKWIDTLVQISDKYEQ